MKFTAVPVVLAIYKAHDRLASGKAVGKVVVTVDWFYPLMLR